MQWKESRGRIYKGPDQEHLKTCTYTAWVACRLSWAVERPPLGGSSLFAGRGAIHGQASWDPRARSRSADRLAAGGHEGKSVVQEGVHGLARLLNRRLGRDILGGWEGQAWVPPQLSGRRCLHVCREVGVGLQWGNQQNEESDTRIKGHMKTKHYPGPKWNLTIFTDSEEKVYLKNI